MQTRLPRRLFRALAALLVGCGATCVLAAQAFVAVSDHASGIYGAEERVGWTLRASAGASPPLGVLTYTVKKNRVELLANGSVDLARGDARIEASTSEPAMIEVELTAADGKSAGKLGAAVAPERLVSGQPVPADFDTFWAEKVKLLQAVAMNPVLTTGDGGREGVDYATLTLDNLRGARVYGQVARPAREGKFPAVLILQWAGGPYPLQKAWVTDRAAGGWLALNIMPHDVPGDMPQAFYDALPRLLKDYGAIGNTDRERSYFLQMYLGAYRAADYLAGREDWDGKTLLVLGASMGGQQAVAVAGLHARVTHLIAHTPAGCDALGALEGRAAGYPNWSHWDKRVVETAPYFDVANFAPRIRARSLVTMGFIDDVTPPVGIWIAFNRIPAPKEAVPMPETPHGHVAKPGQEKAFHERRDAWIAALLAGREP